MDTPATQYPDSSVFYRKLNYAYPLIERGRGAWLTAADGRTYLDGAGGAFVANIGHGLRSPGRAMARQAKRVAYVNGTVFTTPPVEALARKLAALAPGDLDHVYFLCSGSEAVEAACKLARQYWVEVGRPRKQRLVALRPGYHGNTLLALSASARSHYKALYGDWLVDIAFIPAPYPYRCGCVPDGAMCDTCANALERTIIDLGPETVAAFIAEPIGGSSTGASVPHPHYFRRVREVCDRHDVLFIADEVLSGAGRTGTWTAIEQFGVVPDIMTMGKGITGGYAPLSVVLAPRRLLDPIQHGTGALVHAQTFSHHAVLCAAGLAALRYIKRRDLVARCRALAPQFHLELESLRDIAIVGDVRGRGLLAGIELVEDRTTRAPFPRQIRIAERVATAALDAGLTVWPNVGQANGTDGDLVLLAPPFIIDPWEIQELVARLGKALRHVAATLTATRRFESFRGPGAEPLVPSAQETIPPSPLGEGGQGGEGQK